MTERAVRRQNVTIYCSDLLEHHGRCGRPPDGTPRWRIRRDREARDAKSLSNRQRSHCARQWSPITARGSSPHPHGHAPPSGDVLSLEIPVVSVSTARRAHTQTWVLAALVSAFLSPSRRKGRWPDRRRRRPAWRRRCGFRAQGSPARERKRGVGNASVVWSPRCAAPESRTGVHAPLPRGSPQARISMFRRPHTSDSGLARTAVAGRLQLRQPACSRAEAGGALRPAARSHGGEPARRRLLRLSRGVKRHRDFGY